MVQSMRSCKIALRDGSIRTLQYAIEPVVPSLNDCLMMNLMKPSAPQDRSMRCTPSYDSHRHLFKRICVDKNVRKVRFAAFDAVHIIEQEDERREDLWWSPAELNQYRPLECGLDKSERSFLKAYNEGFRELNLTKTISVSNKLSLVEGCVLGYLGLPNIVSTEWRCVRRLDIRCIVASIIAVQNLSRQCTQYTSRDIANIVASHAERLSQPHRMWSTVIGEAQKIAVEIS